MRKSVIACTTLKSRSGNLHPFVIEFSIRDGKVRDVKILKTGKVSVRPWQLLDLIIQVYDFPDNSMVKIAGSKSHRYPALKIINTGKIYSMDHIVDPSWLTNKDLAQLASWWASKNKLRKDAQVWKYIVF